MTNNNNSSAGNIILGRGSPMFTKKHYINLISVIFIWFSGVIFIVKTLGYTPLTLILYSLIFPAVVLLIDRADKLYRSFLTKNVLFLSVLIVTAAAIMLYRLNYIDYPPFAGFIILCLIIFYHAQDVKTSMMQLVVFLLSPVLYLELLSFSGLFALSVLIVLSIFISDRFLDKINLNWKFFLIAFLFGVTLSANLLVCFVYLIYLLFIFRNDFGKGLIFLVFMLIIYASVTYLAKEGYIVVQVSQNHLLNPIPYWIKILLLLLTFYNGWLVADYQEVLFSSGVIFFVAFLISMIFKINQFGWNKNEIDFSLVIMAVSLLVLSLKEYKVDRFLGKVP